jgi:hypothetical protein
MRIRGMVGAVLAGGLMLAAMVPVLAHAQSPAPARAAGTTPQTVMSDSMAMSGPMVMPHQAVTPDSKHLDAQLRTLRRATDQFHSIAVAEQQGYGLLTDVSKIACIDMPGMGAMGVHWAKPALVGDGNIRLTTPEAMVYAPGPDGTLTLAAVEYVVLKADWDAKHHHAPALFGHTFTTTDAPNRFGLPAFYSLHVWVWKHNPAGTFAMFNPNVMCPM